MGSFARVRGTGVVLLFVAGTTAVPGQTKKSAEPTAGGGALEAAEMAEQGRCGEAIPLLKRAMGRVQEKDLKRRIGADGVRCAMALNDQANATSFLAWLEQQFPRDPEILFMAAHVYWDLYARSSQALMDTAPDSPLVVELNAENLEKQGEWKKAIDEYRVLLQRAPEMPGIHYRIARLLMLQPGTASTGEEARKEAEGELKIYPQNAGAEYLLGELARNADKLPEAIAHFQRALSLNAGLTDAYFGLGRALVDSDRPADAVPPLETAARLAPDNPTIHFTLATAYQRVGRKEDAAREFALQKTTAEKIRRNTNALRRGIAGVAPEKSSQ